MNFVSDNCAGAAPEVFAALARANATVLPSYGDDHITKDLSARVSALFERECAVFPVATGTAANALSLASIVPAYGAIFCHAQSHIMVDECGAPEFFTHGAKLIAVSGDDGKIDRDDLIARIATLRRGDPHSVQPSCVSLTQATERGTVYHPEEVRNLADVARTNDMAMHMDGARFANAIASLGCTPAEATWRAGIDVLSFGGTKNGCMLAEMIIFFDAAMARNFAYRRKKSGHLLSKMRFVSAQLVALLEHDLWLRLASRANSLAERLATGLTAISPIRIVHPVQANAVFASLPDGMAVRLRIEGAEFLDWEPPANGRTIIRLLTSFATQDDDVDRLLILAAQLARSGDYISGQ